MKLQQKILLTLLPISLIGLIVLGLWSYEYSRRSLHDREIRFSELVLDQVMRDVLTHKFVLLDRAGVVDIPVFRNQYSLEIQQEILNISRSTGRDILIFDHKTGALVMSSLHASETERHLSWRRHFQAKIHQGHTMRYVDTLDGPQGTEVYSAAFEQNWKWLAIVSYQDQVLQNEMSQLRNFTFLGTVSVLIISILAFQWISNLLILNPVHRLKDAANEIARTRSGMSIDVKSQDELGMLARNMEQMSYEIEMAMAQAQAAADTKAAFLANMSHEIRTPMNGMLGMLELFQKTKLSTQQKSYLAIMQQSGELLVSVINDILDISKLEVGRIKLDLQPIDIIGLLRRTMELQRKAATDRQNSLMFVSTIDEPELTVYGDPVRLQQCVQNLLSNAIKFTRNGSVVMRLEAREYTQERITLDISVMDTGIGIPEEKMSLLFERFEQMDISTTRKYGGTGLGLSIVKQLMELMGGSVSVESEVGHGSTFSLKVEVDRITTYPSLSASSNTPSSSLSKTQPDTDTPAGVTAATPARPSQLTPQHDQTQPVPPEPTHTTANSAKVTTQPVLLVIEPNRVNQMVIEALAENEDVELRMTRAVQAAQTTLKNTAVDAILIAEELEDMSGPDGIDHIRQVMAQQRNHRPIFALVTSMPEQQMSDHPMYMADGHLAMPLQHAELKYLVDQIKTTKKMVALPDADG